MEDFLSGENFERMAREYNLKYNSVLTLENKGGKELETEKSLEILFRLFSILEQKLHRVEFERLRSFKYVFNNKTKVFKMIDSFKNGKISLKEGLLLLEECLKQL